MITFLGEKLSFSGGGGGEHSPLKSLERTPINTIKKRLTNHMTLEMTSVKTSVNDNNNSSQKNSKEIQESKLTLHISIKSVTVRFASLKTTNGNLISQNTETLTAPHGSNAFISVVTLPDFIHGLKS